METKYIATLTTTREGVWLRNLLKSLEVVPHADDLVMLHSSIISAINYSKKSISNQIHRDQTLLIRDTKEEVLLNYIPTGQIVNDPLTKPLALDLFIIHKSHGLKEMVMKYCKGDGLFSLNINEISVTLLHMMTTFLV